MEEDTVANQSDMAGRRGYSVRAVGLESSDHTLQTAWEEVER